MFNTALFTNNASTVLAAAVSTTSQTTITVASGTGGLFPSPAVGEYFPVTLTRLTFPNGPPWEIMYCTSRTGDVLTVLRGQEGTTPTTWAIGDNIQLLLTAGVLGNFPQFAQNTGRLVNTQTFTSSGTFTPLSAYTSFVVVDLQAAGGGGGGTPSTDGAHVAAAGGGAAGGRVVALITTGFAGLTVTLGAAGSGVTGSAGTDAAQSSFGGLVTVPGGGGGGAGTGTTGTFGTPGGTPGGIPSGGNVFAKAGGQGGYGTAAAAAGIANGGPGASTVYGDGGVVTGGTAAGAAATGYGAGGGGSAAIFSGDAQPGGNGAPAICIIYEYS